MNRTPRRNSVFPGLQRIAQKAKEDPQAQFTSLAHHLTLDLYREAWSRLSKGSSPGVDGVTARRYEQNLEENLRKLQERVKELDHYRAPPALRKYIPKEGSTNASKPAQRPIAIGVTDDKVAQGGVRILLETIYEQDFLPFSFGFRPGRGPHDALEALWQILMQGWVTVVLDVDIQGFYDTMQHPWIMRFVGHRIKDRTILRLIGKWLNAGVMENGRIEHPEKGAPQGAVISPVLSNLYLHHVLDLWADRRMKPQMKGKMAMIRYADDVVVCFQYQEDAEKLHQALKERLAVFGLTLHPEKTKLVPFRKTGSERNPEDNDPSAKPPMTTSGTFDVLGFTHYWGRSRQGTPVVKRKTSGKRLRRFLLRIWQWCKEHRHAPLEEQAQGLSLKLQGHYNYYGLTHNMLWIKKAYYEVCRAWRFWLKRRSQRGRARWDWLKRQLARFRVPTPHLPRSWLRLSLQGQLF
jgi:group II intron reverse transcriptase/maturase